MGKLLVAFPRKPKHLADCVGLLSGTLRGEIEHPLAIVDTDDLDFFRSMAKKAGYDVLTLADVTQEITP